MVSLRTRAKHVLAVAAHGSGVLAVARRLRAPLRGLRVHVFGWHRVVHDAAIEARHTLAPLCVSRASFVAQLEHLCRHYVVWPLERAAAALAGERPAPPRDVAVLTFDDGYRDVLEVAAPELQARGMPATLFVTTGCVAPGPPLPHDRLYALLGRARSAGLPLASLGGTLPVPPLARAEAALANGDRIGALEDLLGALEGRAVARLGDLLSTILGEPDEDELPPRLSWSDLPRLHAHGFSLGSHTVTHPSLPREPDEGLARELLLARAVLAERGGQAPTALAYPGGRTDARVVAAALRAGYRIGIATAPYANATGCDPMRMGRMVVTEGHASVTPGRPSPALVAAQLDGLFIALSAARPARRMSHPWA